MTSALCCSHCHTARYTETKWPHVLPEMQCLVYVTDQNCITRWSELYLGRFFLDLLWGVLSFFITFIITSRVKKSDIFIKLHRTRFNTDTSSCSCTSHTKACSVWNDHYCTTLPYYHRTDVKKQADVPPVTTINALSICSFVYWCIATAFLTPRHTRLVTTGCPLPTVPEPKVTSHLYRKQRIQCFSNQVFFTATTITTFR
jgi:hypothetical protein